MEKFDFDYMSEHKLLEEGYCDPLELPFGSEDTDIEDCYYSVAGYEIQHNGKKFRVSDWVFIVKKQWRVEIFSEREIDKKWTWAYKGDFDSLALALARVKELAAE